MKLVKRSRHPLKILYVPDCHARVKNSLRRFTVLGRFIRDKQPDIVVFAGDFGDFPSVGFYDQGSLYGEGRRYKDDVAVANEALACIFRELRAMKPRPQFYITLGNHCIRPDRAAAADPKYYGTISSADVHFARYGIEVVPFLKPLVIQDITFQHYFTSGVMGKAIGGDNHARNLLMKNHVSSVCGHSHLKDYSETVRGDGRKIFGLVGGCYDEGWHHYTTEQRRWWSGLVILHGALDGYAEHAFYSLPNYLLSRYL